MRKKKKWILLAIVVLLCLRGCGSKPARSKKPAATLPTVSQTQATETSTIPVTEPVTEAPTEPATTAPATEAPTESATTAPTGIRPEFKAAMDSYEAFFDEYCTFMEKFYKNPSDLSMLAQYAGMLTRLEEVNKSFEAWDQKDMTNEELKYYLDVTVRVEKRMLDLM